MTRERGPFWAMRQACIAFIKAYTEAHGEAPGAIRIFEAGRDWIGPAVEPKAEYRVFEAVDSAGRWAVTKDIPPVRMVLAPGETFQPALNPKPHCLDVFGDCVNPGCTYPSVDNLDESKCTAVKSAVPPCPGCGGTFNGLVVVHTDTCPGYEAVKRLVERTGESQ